LMTDAFCGTAGFRTQNERTYSVACKVPFAPTFNSRVPSPMLHTPDWKALAGFDVTGCEASSGRSVSFRPERMMVERFARSTFDESVIVIWFRV